jgi:hypothetical protein
MAMVMAGQGGHGWARFRTRLSLSFDFSCVIFARAKKKFFKVRKGEGEPGNEATNKQSSYINYLKLVTDDIAILSSDILLKFNNDQLP